MVYETSMATYDLFLESGPKHRTTMCHLLSDAMLGCNSNRPTTEEAVAAAPAGIRLFLAFLARHGAAVDASAPVAVRVVAHQDQGDSWYGRGSPYLAFGPDIEPVTPVACAGFAKRLRWMREDLAAWVSKLSGEELDAQPVPRGRPARQVILHILTGPGGYLSPSLDGSKGYSTIGTQAERGLLGLSEALLQVADKAAEDLAAATPEQRKRVLQRPSGELRTLRKSVRRMLEHDWEHYAELARRPGGPPL